MRRTVKRVALWIALVVALLAPSRAAAHPAYHYVYSSVPRWAHYQPPKRQVHRAPVRHAQPAPVRHSGYADTWLVTYYLATGSPMANGQYPFIGAAACGNDVALGAHVYVPGFGTFTCLDRIGFQPCHHIDLFDVPLGTHYAIVTVYP